MLFELVVGWRYLIARKWSKAALVVLAVALVCAAFGAVALLWGSAKISAAGLLIAGALGLAIAACLALFSSVVAVSVIGLAIGVATVVAALAITGGYQQEMQRKVLGVNAHVMVFKYGVDFAEYRRVISTAEAMDTVQAAGPFVISEMLMLHGGQPKTVMVKGIDSRRVGRVLDLAGQMARPRLAGPAGLAELLAPQRADGLPGVIVGCELARERELKLGDRLRLVSPVSNLFGRASADQPPGARGFDFRVGGVFCCGFAEYDKRLVYIDFARAQRFFEHGDVAMGVEIRLKDPLRSPGVARRLLRRLGGAPYRTMGWREINHALFTVLATQKVILTAVVGIIVLVAAFNVLAGLAVLVLRKRREIAALKALGASRGQVARLFQVAGLLIWGVGATLGVGLGALTVALLHRYGLPIDARIYQISVLPVRVEPMDFLLTALAALLLCALATLYPALRAARVEAVEGLRHG